MKPMKNWKKNFVLKVFSKADFVVSSFWGLMFNFYKKKKEAKDYSLASFFTEYYQNIKT